MDRKDGMGLRAWWLMGVAGGLMACGDPNVVAEVGKREVSKGDVSAFIAARSARDVPTATQALDALVDRSLLADEARRAGLDKDPGVRARLRTAEREVLAQALLDQRLAAATDEAKLREGYTASREKWVRREVHVRQIMVRVPPGADEATRSRLLSRINGLYARLVGGEPFETVAREGSEDTVSAPRGGDLGPVLEGQVDEGFFTEAARLGKGERSRPFATSFGLHVLEAVEPVRTVEPTFEQVRGRLEAETRRDAQEALMKDLRERIPVTRHPDRLETGASEGQGPRS
ncbi:peptidylprolyl isomerase [Myxococcus sp. K15C18031901]|uniref:peptidylprolyl isomerase n=1 Tax=Myxococcus dinghuensis TaxID=2906761 RepID=UPI0020A76D5E|nr:peptidylprolyl isomerase [Myxococcus dinghuensis]MCP3101728.1 peptidylprolyl isomerase [Myxococcus dinghuensis]